jgi:5'-nucleotidase
MATMNRRKFLKSTVAIGAGSLLYLYSDGSYKMTFAAGPAVYRLRVLHTNDHHARVVPFAATDTVTIRSTPTPAAQRLFGGLARRKTKLDELRTLYTGQNLLTLDAGDVFQGTLYFNQYLGQADLWFYNRLGYDAVAIGNHEFDKGPQPLVDFVKGFKGITTGANTLPAEPTAFPVIAANITTTDPVLAPALTTGAAVPGNQIGAYITKTLGGQKIGIFGLTTPETKVSSSPGPNTDFADPATAAQAVVNTLRTTEGCNFVIALSHIGYELDKSLAGAVTGIDLIVGGHSHTRLLPADTSTLGPIGVSAQGPYATPIYTDNTNSQVKTAIVTDWEWGKWVGDVEVAFDAAGLIAEVNGTVHPLWADVLPTGRELIPGEPAAVVEEATFKAAVDDVFAPPIQTLQNTKIGTIPYLLEGGTAYRQRESTGGDVIADAILARAKAFQFPDGKAPTLAITNSGGIRAEIKAGDVTVGSVLTVLPFGNTIATVDLTGAQVIAALENGASQVEANGGRFPQVAGLRFFWTKFGTPALQLNEVPNRPAQKGNRILRVEVLGADGKTYTPIGLTTTYRVVTNNFMVGGGDGYFAFTAAGDRADPSVGGGTNQLDTQLIMADAVQEYIAAGNAATRPTQGRIIGVQAVLPIVTRPAEVSPAAAVAR